MKTKIWIPVSIVILISITQACAKTDGSQIKNTEKKFQAKAPQTQPFGKEAFAPSKTTTLRWLGMAGFLINSRGTTMMVLQHIVITIITALRHFAIWHPLQKNSIPPFM